LRRATATAPSASHPKVWLPLAVEKPIPYARAVDMSFVRRAQAKYTS